MSPILSDIGKAIAHGDSFCVSKSENGQWHVNKRSLWNRFFFWGNSCCQTRRIGQVAKVVNQEIRKLPRMGINAAL